jgi:hypothetical protein
VRHPPSDPDPPSKASPPPEPGRGPPAAFLPVSFATLLSKEIERSRRYYRGFGLVRVSWPSASRPARIHPERQRATSEASGTSPESATLAEAVARSLRRADLITSGPGGGLFVLLPETPASAIGVVSRRIEDVLGRARAGSPQRPEIREAAFPRDGETPDALIEALRGRGED